MLAAVQMSKIARKRGQGRPGYEKGPQELGAYRRTRLSTAPSAYSVASATPTAAPLARASDYSYSYKAPLSRIQGKGAPLNVNVLTFRREK